MASALHGFKRFILWDYPRAGWQYDVIVACILVFIFAIPRELFRDQPKARSVVMLPSERGTNVYWIEPELLAGVAEPQRSDNAAGLLKDRTGKKHTIVRLETIFDAEKDIKGYMAYTTP